MRVFNILLVTGLMISFPVLSKEYTVKSPDNRISLTVEVDTITLYEAIS